MLVTTSKAYVRFRENYPETILHYTAYLGFYQFGAEVVPFYCTDDIDLIEDLGPDVIICGYIGDVWQGLRKLNKPIPPPLDYPEPLRQFLKRNIRQTTMQEIRKSINVSFVKPIEQKLFTGFVYDGSIASRKRVVTISDDTQVWVSECVDMKSEYRCVVRYGEIVDVRRYKGDWSLAPNRDTIESAVKEFELSGEAPAAYTLDFAVTPDDTVLVEANDGFAFGHYGMGSEDYASCLAARWKQMTE